VSAHRRARPPRPAVTGGAVLAGAAVLGLGVGPLVGLASAAPSAHLTVAPAAPTAPAAVVPLDDGPAHDVLWYGLLTTAAVAGAAGARGFAPRRRA
jgi:hypothetical protein